MLKYDVKDISLKYFQNFFIKQVIDIFYIFSTKAVLKYFKNDLLKVLFQINNLTGYKIGYEIKVINYRCIKIYHFYSKIKWKLIYRLKLSE